MKRIRFVVEKTDGTRHRDDKVQEFSSKDNLSDHLSEVMALGYEGGHVVLVERGVVRAIPYDKISEVYSELAKE